MTRQRSASPNATAATTRRIEGRRPLAAAAGAALLLGLAACGGEDASGSGTSGSGASGDGAENTAGTSAESPLAIGDSVEVWGWDVTVTAVELDATESIMAETGMLAQEPDPGHQFAKVTYEGTYQGDEADNSFYSDLVIAFWIDGVEYDDCGANVPAGLYIGGSVDQGDTVSSAFCAQIPADRTGEVFVNVKDWQPTGQTGFFFAAE
ncbi:hypothetical protein K3N28_13060 [Glycomyces sp. TRM65418]|uniref:hypothetical protein n=1 Tax=Glycomyces sp. TRM65418 TaxID=2867006 RepID=UPI001CE50E09|nr:hypothetical protein [Glycomyces sp. TRM65418]MCC3763995.1 hypothetical protein [Glycomyces sp. TRM65418]QZD53691.1 hypothetical protein K3N28_12990 [Glycomyces sp. TRM65418]